MSKPSILFLCTHNAGRSQLGAALLEHLAADEFTVSSAGTAPATSVNDASAATLGELGIDISHRVPRLVTAGLVESADVVVAMKPGLTIPGHSARLIEWSFPDPAEWDTESVRPLRNAVEAAIRREFVKDDTHSKRD